MALSKHVRRVCNAMPIGEVVSYDDIATIVWPAGVRPPQFEASIRCAIGKLRFAKIDVRTHMNRTFTRLSGPQ